MKQKTVITAALPYANGPIHMGHMVEYIQADIFSRFMKLIGEDAIFCCADDTHGTPIEIAAMKKGILPEVLVSEIHKEHMRDFEEFQIGFDSYYSTNSPENKGLSEFIFNELKKKGLIYRKEVELTYCPHCKRFLPDRYVKGKCPKCRAPDQYGDVCEKCNSTHSTTDLVDPFCTICGNNPGRKKSDHYFFKLSACEKQLKDWLHGNKNLQDEVKNYILNWVNEGLKDWDITRDGPYFGFNIPGEKDLYYYVWLDAPIGYIASTANYIKTIRKVKDEAEVKKAVDEYWKKGRIVHFIGKDIIYFHFLFWPAMLMNSGFNVPDDIVVHGFLTVNGEKMSKSRGTFFTARQYLEILGPEYLRFYYAGSLAKTMSDIDLDFNDFKTRINSELVADIGNFAYRTMSFCNKNMGSYLGEYGDSNEEKEITLKLEGKYEQVRKAYHSYNFREAVKHILEVGSIGNKYFQESKPWELCKKESSGDAGSEKQNICMSGVVLGEGAKKWTGEAKKRAQIVSFCLNIIKNISILIKPILPGFSSRLESQLNIPSQRWDNLNDKLDVKKINNAEILVKKLEDEIDKISVKDPFAKLELRVAKVLEARLHPDAEKLIILQIDTGLDKRQICAGLAKYYKPEQMVGRHIVMIRNLKPAKLRGEISAGMLLAAGDDRIGHKILEAKDAKPGTRVTVDGINSDSDDAIQEIKLDDFLEIKIEVENHKPYYKGKALKAGKDEISCESEKGGVR